MGFTAFRKTLLRNRGNPLESCVDETPSSYLPKYSFLIFFFLILIAYHVSGAPKKIASIPDSTTTISKDSSTVILDENKLERIIPLCILKDSVKTFSFNLKKENFRGIITRHTGDYVKNIPGGSIVDRVSTGLPVYSRINGSSVQQTIITIDGFPVNHDQFGPFDLSLLPIEGFRKIEISNFNPTKVVSQTGSTVNLITSEANFEKPLTTIVWRKGSYGDSEVDVEFGQQIARRTNFLGAVSYSSSNGKFPNSKYDAQKIRFQLTSRLKPDWYLKYQLFQNRSDVDIPGPEKTQLETEINNYHQKSNHYINLLDIRGNVKGDSLEDIRIRTYYNSLYQDIKEFSQGIKETYRNRFIGILLQSYYPVKNNQVTYGLKTEYRWIRSNQLQKKGFFDSNIFAKSFFSIFPNHIFSWAGNLEINTAFGTFFSPTLNYEYSPSASFYFGLTSAIERRLPNFYELYLNKSKIKGNAGLKNEKIKYFAVDLALNANLIDFNSSFYIKQIDNPIILVEDEETEDSNIFKNRSSEFFPGYKHILYFYPTDKFTVSSELDVIFKNKLNNLFFINHPQLIKSIALEYQNYFFNNNLMAKIKIVAKYIGNRWSFIGGNYQLPPFYYSQHIIFNEWAPLIDIILDTKISRFFFQISVENLLSYNYQMIYGYPARETSLWMNLSWNFLD